MARKWLMGGLPKHFPGLEEPCPIFLLIKATKIPRASNHFCLKIFPWVHASDGVFVFQCWKHLWMYLDFCGYKLCYFIPFGFPYWIKLPTLDILKFLVTTLSNQDKIVTFVQVDEDGELARSSEFMKTCHNMNIIVKDTGVDASLLNGKSEIPNKTLADITRALLLTSSNKK